MSARPLIEVSGLCARFDDRVVLSDVGFRAYPNQITVILGPSGSGQTTILKHLIGLKPIEEGSVRVEDRRLESLDDVERYRFFLRIGDFYQQGALLNSLTGAENVALPLEQHSDLSRELVDAVVRRKLDVMNMGNAADLYPSQLSGGMLKRAALARAIVMDPPILFCDEPGAGLDPVLLALLDRLILRMKERLGMTVILVTHQPASIMRLADRIVFVEEGRGVFAGPVSAALESEAAAVRRFFEAAKQAETLE